MKLIPTVIATNQENPVMFCAEALGVSHAVLRALILRGLVTKRSNGVSCSIRLSEAAKVAVRNAQAVRADNIALHRTASNELDQLGRQLQALGEQLADKGAREFGEQCENE